jgi:flagellar basal body-associated protein FliL
MRSSVLTLSILLVLTGVARAADTPAPEHKVTQSESYMMLDPMYATIMDGERPGGMLMVAVGLDIPDAQLRAEAKRVLPVLRDAFVRSLMGFTGTHVRIAEQPDVVAIADRLQRITDRELRSKGAHVLLAQVSCRVTN